MEGLFYVEEHESRCKCVEHGKPLSKRPLIVQAYYPEKVWGKAKKTYDGRKLLRVTCTTCGATWKDYNPKSSLWKLIDDDPRQGEEVYYRKQYGREMYGSEN
jgi:hypothetical protein